MDKNIFEMSSKMDQMNKDISVRFENLSEDVFARFESLNCKISSGFENLEFLNPNLIQSKENQGNLSSSEYQNLKEDSNKSDQSKVTFEKVKSKIQHPLKDHEKSSAAPISKESCKSEDPSSKPFPRN